MAVTLRDRVLTTPVARAITSPSGILLAGVGTAAAILGGLALPLAPLVGLAVWAARVAVAIPRRPAGERIDPFRVGEPWRRFVADALQAQRRFDETVQRVRPGPIRERLQGVGRRIADGVTECWHIARQGDNLDGALRGLDEDSIRRELAEVQEERRGTGRTDGDAADAALARTQTAVEAQLAAAQRLRSVAGDARNRLRLLNAQLDEAVARAVEVSLGASDVSQLAPLTDAVEDVVGELEALRQGIEETQVASGGAGGTLAAGSA